MAWAYPSTITNIPARGTWELPGGQQALWVFGSGCYLMTVASGATATAEATFQMQKVGTLNTSVGRVSIRDNGPGGYAVIVDGPFGYLYNIATQAFTNITDPAFLGADRVAFIDGWWIFNKPGSQIFYTNVPQYSITFDGSYFALKDAATDWLVALMENKQELWLIGEKTTEIWYDAGGTYFPFQRLVSTMLQTGCAAAQSVARFVTGAEGLIWLARSERGQNVVVRTEGFQAGVVSTPAINAAIAKLTYTADATGDVIQMDGHEFYILTFPSADKTFVYDGMTNMWHERGSFDPYAGLFHRHRGSCFLNFQGQILCGDYQNGNVYQLTRDVYTDDVWPLKALRRTPHVWDGSKRGRVFHHSLQIDFAPGVGTNPVFSNAALCGGTVAGATDILLSGTAANLYVAGVNFQVNYADGTSFNSTVVSADSVGLAWDIVFADPVPQNIPNKTAIYMVSQYAEDPQALLRVSDDGGATYGNERQIPLGRQGEYLNRAMTRRLGRARDRVYELSVVDPVKRDIVGATLIASAEDDVGQQSAA